MEPSKGEKATKGRKFLVIGNSCHTQAFREKEKKVDKTPSEREKGDETSGGKKNSVPRWILASFEFISLIEIYLLSVTFWLRILFAPRQSSLFPFLSLFMFADKKLQQEPREWDVLSQINFQASTTPRHEDGDGEIPQRELLWAKKWNFSVREFILIERKSKDTSWEINTRWKAETFFFHCCRASITRSSSLLILLLPHSLHSE